MRGKIRGLIKSWKFILIASFFLLATGLFIPFDLEISDERIFQVIDEKGNPVTFCTVEHEWIQYALMSKDSEISYPDKNGFVYLPKRTIRTSWLELIRAAYAKLQMYSINASFKNEDIVTLISPGFETKIIFSDEWHSKKVILENKKPR